MKKVFKFIVQPKTASKGVIGIVLVTFKPSVLNSLFSFTITVMYKSPLLPPFMPS